MDILGVDELGHVEADESSNDHTLLRLHAPSSPFRGKRGEASDIVEKDGSLQAQLHRPGVRRRHKIGKGIQLILLRKYVQCAKQLQKIPDRKTTEQLLEQGYDEFYYQGGNLNEPRLNYAAFLKLVRNRRSECTNYSRRGTSRRQGATRRFMKEQMEIRVLINELEQIRHDFARGRPKDSASMSRSNSEQSRPSDASASTLPDSSSTIEDANIDVAASTGNISTTEMYPSFTSGSNGDSDGEVISRAKLDLILRLAQETLVAQRNLLEEVRVMEQRVAGIQ